jgi:hypothetical protein
MRMLKLENGGSGFHLSPPAGRGRIALAIRVRGALRKGGGNRFKHARHIAEHLVVPKPQHPIVVIGKPFVANNVARVIRVLSSIDFNDEASFAANKIDRIRTDRLLPNEFVSIQIARPQPIPKRGLGFRGVFPQTPRTLRRNLFGWPHAETLPHPDCSAIRPLPASGERLAPHAIQ